MFGTTAKACCSRYKSVAFEDVSESDEVMENWCFLPFLVGGHSLVIDLWLCFSKLTVEIVALWLLVYVCFG